MYCGNRRLTVDTDGTQNLRQLIHYGGARFIYTEKKGSAENRRAYIGNSKFHVLL